MSTNITKLELRQVLTIPTYGGTKTTVEYELFTKHNGIKNNYVLQAEIRGIATADLHLNLTECIPLTNNEETLCMEAIEELLEW